MVLGLFDDLPTFSLLVGTIGACLLQAVYGMDADEALERVQRCFDTREDLDSFNRLRKSPETDEQREFVRNFKPL